MVRDFKQLNIWNQAKDFALDIYKITSSFPESEKFGISNQLRRASSSIGANISEGSGRKTKKEFTYFLYIAMGSIKECEHFLILSKELNYLNSIDYLPLANKLETIGKMLNSFIQKIKNGDY